MKAQTSNWIEWCLFKLTFCLVWVTCRPPSQLLLFLDHWIPKKEAFWRRNCAWKLCCRFSLPLMRIWPQCPWLRGPARPSDSDSDPFESKLTRLQKMELRRAATYQNMSGQKKRPRHSYDQPSRPRTEGGGSLGAGLAKTVGRDSEKKKNLSNHNSPAASAGSNRPRRMSTSAMNRQYFLKTVETAAEKADVIFLQDFAGAREDEIRAMAAKHATTTDAARSNKSVGFTQNIIPTYTPAWILSLHPRLSLIGAVDTNMRLCCRRGWCSLGDELRASGRTNSLLQYGALIAPVSLWCSHACLMKITHPKKTCMQLVWSRCLDLKKLIRTYTAHHHISS